MDADPQKSKRAGFLDRLLSHKPDASSEEEVREAVDDSTELTPTEKQMINEIIDLGDAVAAEICTPRVDVMLVEATDTARVALERMRGTGYSRLPVWADDIDNIVGIVNFKDLIGPLMDGTIDEAVSKFMYEPTFVPESKNVIALLREMQALHQQMVIVVDEYGGTFGILTIEDIIEEIVGEIADESDVRGDMIVEVCPGQWRVEGRFPVEDAALLGWPVESSDDYETIAGWLISELDSVPSPGDTVTKDGYKFTILRMRRSRIALINVTGGGQWG